VALLDGPRPIRLRSDRMTSKTTVLLCDDSRAMRIMTTSILEEHGMLEPAQLDQALAEQRAERESAEQSYRQAVASHALADEIGFAIDSCGKQFTRILKSRSQFSSVLNSADASPSRATACIRVEASTALTLALACDLPTAHRIACAFMRVAPERCDDELARDALGELLNIIMGYVIRDTMSDDEPYTPSPPDLERSLPQLMSALGGSLVVAMKSELGEFELMVGR